MSSFSVSGKTDFSRQKTIREEKEEEKREQQRRRRGGDEKTQVGSIQVSTGQPQWSGPEKGSDGRCKSCRSQAHHGCSPDPLHVWLPIAAILLLPPLPLCLYMVVSPITAMEKERKRERGGGGEFKRRIQGGQKVREEQGEAQKESTGMSVAFSGQG